MAYLGNLGNILMLAFGFGFVIFWHELGHFLAAKWAKVKVEQFAVGFGQAVVCWRKGLGFTWGTSHEAFLSKVKSHIETKYAGDRPLNELVAPTEAQIATAAQEIGISETEYRLNWIPLGGYVKMMGQDDLKPGQTVSDPRSYNNKTIGQRMVIVSAGMVMNIILAAIGFMYIFTVGLDVPSPRIGSVVPGSPAMSAYTKSADGSHHPAPLQVGDTIMTLNGWDMPEFEKVKLHTLLLIAGETVPMTVKRADGKIETVYVTPSKATAESEFPQVGVGEYPLLETPDKEPDGKEKDGKPAPKAEGSELAEFTDLKPGDVIKAVNGTPVGKDDYNVLDKALQEHPGQDVKLSVESDGKPKVILIKPHFMEHFGDTPLNFAGMELPVRIDMIQPGSPLLADAKPGDVITNVADPSPSGGQIAYPTRLAATTFFNAAGEKGVTLKITLDRDGQPVGPFDAKPSVKLASKRFGYNIILSSAEGTPVVAGVLPDSPAKAAGVRPGSRLIAINGTKVGSWFDVNNIMGQLKPDQPVKITATYAGEKSDYTIKSLNQQQIDQIQSNRFVSYAVEPGLKLDMFPRKAPNHNLLIAAKMGAEETRDAILQVYQTVRSMSRGSISYKEVSGPVGILSAGYKIAERGTTRLVWFLAIISANLAVMNFLPIPIVDGGLFTFLIIEKLKGSPISQRTQGIAQAVGLVLLLSVFVFATYQDVARLPSMFK